MACKKIGFVLIIAILILYPDARTLAAKPPTYHSAKGGVLTIKATVNNTPLTMLIDTGAQRSVIDPAVVFKLGHTRISDSGIIRSYSEALMSEVQVQKFTCASSFATMAYNLKRMMNVLGGRKLTGALQTE